MRRKVSLYIADRLVDLDDQSFILFNYTMEDLSNPTIVRNSFSQQVTLKGTPNNNRIFGDIFRLDRETLYGDSYTGAYFDVTRKTPFTIYNEMGEIVESGYLKLDEVSRSGKMVEYKVTFYGGLGSFFYGLSYREDGTPRTLADLRYRMVDGGFTRSAGHFGAVGGYAMLKDCWSYLDDPEDYVNHLDVVDCWWTNIINFAPCYNGLPDGFSSDKALVDNRSFDNVPYSKVVDGKTYTFKEGTDTNLMLFTNPHNEWEIRDLRWYLQRPVFSIKALFDAICDLENNGGYEVILDPSFFTKSNNLYWNGWITLPLIAAEDRHSPEAIRNLLASSLSPADYIISFAKIFGLVFFFNKQRQITIMPRRAFYDETSVIDLTGKVNVADIRLSSVLAQSRFYQYGGGKQPKEEWASSYLETYGEDYGIQLINTGNEFNKDKTIITKDIVFKEAVEVQERSLLFTSYDMDRDVGEEVDRFNLCDFEGVNVQLWRKDESGNDAMVEIPITIPYQGFLYPINPAYPLSDWLPKMQFHDKDNKATDGANALVVFNGMKDTTRWESWAKLFYWLTDDSADMETLNQGQPCWNFSKINTRKIERLPSFRSCTTYDVDGDDVISETYEYGVPKARGVNGVFHNSQDVQTIYNRYWKNYIKDRYDDDTFKMTCKVNLRGLRVGQELMRNFFYYDGAVFVLNAIRNHSLTTWDDTECEFIRVQSKTNYTK